MSFSLTEEQERAVSLSFENSPLVVLTGGPGTGKSYTTRAIVDAHHKMRRRVLLAAPTGKAARRLSDATDREAKTLHRLLEWEPSELVSDDESGKFGAQIYQFRRGPQNPLDADLVIVDEASMVDARLMRALLVACVKGRTKVLLVGDADQLPPVGSGAPFQDIVASQAVPVVALKTIHRQAEGSRIVQNAHRILRGDELFLENVGDDFVFVDCPRVEHAAEEVLRWMGEELPRQGFHAMRDVQVLAPQNNGPLGTEALSLQLQEKLNPITVLTPTAAAPFGSFRLQDRVIQTRNDYTRAVMNGEWGQIDSIDKEAVRVDLGDRSVAYPRNELRDLMLAYALTVHRSQGSEYRAVIVLVHSSQFYMLSRTLLYTAITRGKERVVLIGDRRGIKRAVANNSATRRRTLLAKLLEKKAREGS